MGIIIHTYTEAEAFMETARDTAKGKPMTSASWRMYKDGDEYPVCVGITEVGRFLPDNTFMFTVEGQRARAIAQRVSSTIDRVLPFHWTRIDMARYRVDHDKNLAGSTGWARVREHFKTPTTAPELYDGIKFRLSDGRCLNPKADRIHLVDAEKRKEWLAARKAWMLKIKTLDRVGGFDKLVAEEKRNPTPWRDRPMWNSKDIDILYKAIKTGDCSIDILKMLVASEVRQWETVAKMGMTTKIDRLLNTHSVALRARFGVFTTPLEEKMAL